METAKNYEKNSKIFIELREILSKLSSCPFYESILALINRQKRKSRRRVGKNTDGAPCGNRTRIFGLGSRCSTTELRVRVCYYRRFSPLVYRRFFRYRTRTSLISANSFEKAIATSFAANPRKSRPDSKRTLNGPSG